MFRGVGRDRVNLAIIMYKMALISVDLFNSLPNLPKLQLDSTLEI